MRTPCYTVTVHQYEREVLLYCTSKPHKVLHKGSGLRIRSRESRDKDTWASKSRMQTLRLISKNFVVAMCFFYLRIRFGCCWLVASLIHLINYLLLPDLW